MSGLSPESGTLGDIRERFDLVIFDCDGVLVDSEVLSCRCLADVLGWHGAPIAVDEVFDRFLGRGSAAIGDYYLERTGCTLPPSFRTDLASHLGEAFRTSLRLMPHVPEVLQRLDCRFCLATSSDNRRVEMTLELSGLKPYFGDRVFTAAMVANSKPAPDLFLLAAERMGASAGRALVIEDSVTGVIAGKRAAMTVWGFIGGSHHSGRDGGRLLEQAGADRIFTSLSDLVSL